MQYILMSIFTLIVVALDQFTKYLTLQNIPLYGHMDLLPGFLGLTYVQNRGAAFSILQNAQWLFAIIFVVIAAFIVWEFSKKRLPFTDFERWLIVAIFAGGIGNTIDRLRFGFVVDMIQTEFMNFPVFNVADCFITCGCLLLIAHLFLFNKEFWKEEKKK